MDHIKEKKFKSNHVCQQESQASGLEISARPLAQASVKTVGRVQVTDHSPGLASTILISGIYYSKY